jgi:hypothetical protein
MVAGAVLRAENLSSDVEPTQPELLSASVGRDLEGGWAARGAFAVAGRLQNLAAVVTGKVGRPRGGARDRTRLTLRASERPRGH